MTKFVEEIRNMFAKPYVGGLIVNEIKMLDSFWRHHKYGILAFLSIYLSFFLTFTALLWLPLLIFNLFTTFPLGFVVFNFTPIMNRPIKFIWRSFFELMARTQSDLHIHEQDTIGQKEIEVKLDNKNTVYALNIGYADMFDT
jgi:hypothetical protein